VQVELPTTCSMCGAEKRTVLIVSIGGDRVCVTCSECGHSVSVKTIRVSGEGGSRDTYIRGVSYKGEFLEVASE
jgi:transcription elongation factor Elf1